MKEEIKRILKLVKDKKISVQEGIDLVEALYSEQNSKENEPFTEEIIDKFLKSFHKTTQEIQSSEQFKKISESIQKGTETGFQAIKDFAEKASKTDFISNLIQTKEEKKFELPFSIDENKTLKISNHWGNIRVVGDTEEDKIFIQSTAYGQNQEEAIKILKNFTPMIEESEEQVVLDTGKYENLKLDIEVHVKKMRDLNLESTYGTAKIMHVNSNIGISGENVQLELYDCAGAICISIEKGNISASNIDASVMHIENQVGHVDLINTTGDLKLKVINGNIGINNTDSKLIEAETVAGNISLSIINKFYGKMRLSTVQGNVKAHVPKDSNAQIALSSVSGAVINKIKLINESQHNQSVTGVMGEGNGLIEINTVSGNIQLD